MYVTVCEAITTGYRDQGQGRCREVLPSRISLNAPTLRAYLAKRAAQWAARASCNRNQRASLCHPVSVSRGTWIETHNRFTLRQARFPWRKRQRRHRWPLPARASCPSPLFR